MAETRLFPATELRVGDVIALDWCARPAHHEARIDTVTPAPGLVRVDAHCTEPGCGDTVRALYGTADLVELISRPVPAQREGGW